MLLYALIFVEIALHKSPCVNLLADNHFKLNALLFLSNKSRNIYICIIKFGNSLRKLNGMLFFFFFFFFYFIAGEHHYCWYGYAYIHATQDESR